jgi:hypothetical protein
MDKTVTRKSGRSTSVLFSSLAFRSRVPSLLPDWLFVGKDTDDREHNNDETPQCLSTRPDDARRPSR